MHRLLRQQLHRLGLGADAAPGAEEWRTLLAEVSRAYEQADEASEALEQSLQVASRETRELSRELRRSEANFKALVEHLPDAVFVVRDQVIQYANPSMARLLGFDQAADLVDKRAVDLFLHPDDRGAMLDAKRRHDDGATRASLRLRWIRRDGTVISIEGASANIVYDGLPSRLIIAGDITARLDAETSMRQSEERYRALFEGSPLSILLFDPVSLQILAANKAASTLYGYSIEELLKLTIQDLKVVEGDPELARTVRLAATPGTADALFRVWRGTKQHRTKDGRILDIHIASHAVTLGGRPALLAIGDDVTEKRKLEEQLRQSQKMEAIGQLAGGVAHDFNNILAVILTATELALEALDPAHVAREDVLEIDSAARRAAALTRQLLMFARREAETPQVLAVDTLVKDLEKMIRRLIGETIAVTSTMEPGLGRIEADRSQMEQVLVNLVVNARDAMPTGGTLAIQAVNADLEEPGCRTLGLPPGRYVKLSVSDTGTGMDDATRARIFDPFFTTKEVGKGTGLGLSTVFGIVERCKGAISVASQVGRGTTFDIYLPRTDARPGATHLKVPPNLAALHGETLLLVEDEDQVRRLLARVLASAGYQVLEATSGRSGLAMLAEHGHVDLVVTDLVMPDIDGRTMAAEAMAKDPSVRVLYMSGYTDHPMLKGALLRGQDHFIQKPFSVKEMLSAVRGALEARRSSSRKLYAINAPRPALPSKS